MKLIQDGPRKTNLIVVGEAPGANEERQGKPFVGASGRDLDDYLGAVNIMRASVFVTNVCHVRPPGNKIAKFMKPPTKEFLLGVIRLKKDIEEIRPNLVLALGDVPLQMLTNRKGIGNYRGSILESTLVPGQKVIATYHPAAVFRTWEYRALIQFDMERVAKEAQFPEIKLEPRIHYVWPNVPDGMVEEVYNAEWVSFDIETSPEPGKHSVTSISFSDTPNRAIVFPHGQPAEIVQRLLQSPAKKCGQNAGQYDCVVLEDNGIPVNNFQWETMYGHHALMLEAASGGDEVKSLTAKSQSTASFPLKKGLAFQTSIYTDIPYYKADGKLWKKTGDLDMFYRYNAMDTMATAAIREVQEREIKDFNVGKVFKHEMDMLPMLIKMTRRGVKVDLDQRAAFHKSYTEEIKRLQDFFDSQAGGPVNTSSSKQMQALLYDKLGLPVQVKKDTGRPTTDKDAILKLAEKYQHPVLMAILEIRKRRKLLESYLDLGIVDSDGRIRCLFDPSGTQTGRLASRANIYGTGTNLQNQPPVLRRMFVADTGKVFFYVDLSQAEARVVAWLARCESLIELFLSGRDIHKENAIRFFGEYKEETRITVKRIVHGSNYGEGVDRIVAVARADGISLDRQEVVEGQDAYFMLYPEIKENFWGEVKSELKYRLLETPLGWKRQFFSRWDHKLINRALAFKPQCTVGVLAEMGMMRADKVPGAEILLNVHDAVLGQCDEDKVDTVVPKIIEAMELEFNIFDRPLVIPADAKVGRNWGDYSDDNPEGLRKWKVA